MKKLILLALVLGLAGAPLARAENETKKEKKAARRAAKREAVANNGNGSNGHRAFRANNRRARRDEVGVNQAAKKAAKVNRREVKAENRRINRRVDKAVKRDFRYNAERLSFNDARLHFRRERHDRFWWDSHFSRIVSYGGGYWYWNSGWWYPAYGYNPGYNNYVYEGPVYGYGYTAPGEITAQVQRALAQRGYYYGPIDGIVGPLTRNAIREYQADAGLAVTSVMDEPTLATLGLV